MGSEGGIQCDDTFLGHRRSGTVVDGGRGHQADSTMAVFVVVPLEELPAVNASVLDRAEALREVGSVFQSFELRLGVRIVIRDVRAAVGLGDIEIDEQRGYSLRSHAGAAIGMERESPGRDVFFLHGIGDEVLGEFGGLPMSDQPADDIATVDIEDHVEMEAGPLGRALQFGDVPGPHFVGADRQEFGLGVERMDALTPALTGLAAVGRSGEKET